MVCTLYQASICLRALWWRILWNMISVVGLKLIRHLKMWVWISWLKSFSMFSISSYLEVLNSNLSIRSSFFDRIRYSFSFRMVLMNFCCFFPVFPSKTVVVIVQLIFSQWKICFRYLPMIPPTSKKRYSINTNVWFHCAICWISLSTRKYLLRLTWRLMLVSKYALDEPL